MQKAGGARQLPDRTMTTADGRLVATGDYRHRKHLVLVFLPGTNVSSGIAALASLTARYREFAMEEAEILAVRTASPPASPYPEKYPFPVLVDRDETLCKELIGLRQSDNSRTAVCIADRYGEIFHSLDACEGEPFPVDEVLSWLRFLERLCPE